MLRVSILHGVLFACAAMALSNCATSHCCLTPRRVLPQNPGGGLMLGGVVRDSSGELLPGVSVFARLDGCAPRSTTTDADGRYVFRGLAPGYYCVCATVVGYTRFSHTAVLAEENVLLDPVLTYEPGTAYNE